MSLEMDEEIRRWTARRQSALGLDVIEGKTTVSESFSHFEPPLSDIESWSNKAKAGIENALKDKLEDISKQYELPLKAREVYGEGMP